MENIPSIEQIKQVGLFEENRIKNKYGFTLELQNETILNIYISGNYYDNLKKIDKLKKQYLNLTKKLINKKGEEK